VILYILPITLPIILYLISRPARRKDNPFMSGFEYKARRIKYRDPWVLFAFLFVVFEEFLIIIMFLAPHSIETFVFYSTIIAAMLLVVVG